jgi:hypothetical protein
MASISSGLPQIHDLGFELAPEESPLNQGSHNPQNLGAGSNSPDQIGQTLAGVIRELEKIGQALVGLSQDLGGGNQTQSGGGSRFGADGGSQNGGGQFGSQMGSTKQSGSSNEAPPTAYSPGAPPPAYGGTSSASGTAGASGSTALSGNESIGPKVPSALQPFQQEIGAAAKQTGVPASLIGAQILQESGGNANAVTTNPALGLADSGLMQVDSATFAGLQKQYPDLLGGKSVSDPATNIMAGALLDAQLIKQNNGNVSQALTDYNGNATSGYANDVLAKQTALQNGTAVPGGFS